MSAALRGELVGTFFHPTGRRQPTRLLWLRHASDARGVLQLDAGAVRAVVQRKASLLPAGVVGVNRSVLRGGPVDLVGPDGVLVARGLVNYDSDDVPALLGRSTREIASRTGCGYDRTSYIETRWS